MVLGGRLGTIATGGNFAHTTEFIPNGDVIAIATIFAIDAAAIGAIKEKSRNCSTSRNCGSFESVIVN
jgi:hypothetical protein